MEELDNRLRSRGEDSDEKIKERLLIAEEEVKHAETDGFHDTKILNGNIADAYTLLERYIFDPAAETEKIVDGAAEETIAEVTMEDV